MKRAIVLAAALLFAGTAFADRVELDNGQSFEGVIANRVGDKVTIRLTSGSISLPAERVVRLEKGESALADYLDRRAALEQRSATADDWAGLALWALARDFEPGIQRSALRAAVLDPNHESLPALLRPRGYRLDEDRLEWITEAELMSRRGLVRWDGEWIDRAERDRKQAELDKHLAALREEMWRRRAEPVYEPEPAPRTQGHAAIPLSAAYATTSAVVVVPYPVVYPVAFLPQAPVVRPPGVQPPLAPPAQRPAPRVNTFQDLARHQPGSIIPLSVSSPP